MSTCKVFFFGLLWRNTEKYGPKKTTNSPSIAHSFIDCSRFTLYLSKHKSSSRIYEVSHAMLKLFINPNLLVYASKETRFTHLAYYLKSMGLSKSNNQSFAIASPKKKMKLMRSNKIDRVCSFMIIIKKRSFFTKQNFCINQYQKYLRKEYCFESSFHVNVCC